MFSSRYMLLYGGHRDEINCLVFSSDLEILLSGSIEGCIRIWNTVYDHLTCKIREHSGRIRRLALSKNDQYFASISNDIDVHLYRTRTASLVYSLAGHTRVSDCLQFSSDNQFLASGSWDCRTIVWKVETGEQIYDFHHHTDAIQSIAFHPTRNCMVTGSYDQHISFYHLDQFPSVQPLQLHGHFNNIRSLDFSSLPYFASGGCDKIIIVWQIETKRVHTRLFGHATWIQAMTFHSNDGSILASVDDDTVYIWNIMTSHCLHHLSLVNDLTCCIRFLPNRNSLLVGGAVYEVVLNENITCEERIRTKRIDEEPEEKKKRKLKH